MGVLLEYVCFDTVLVDNPVVTYDAVVPEVCRMLRSVGSYEVRGGFMKVSREGCLDRNFLARWDCGLFVLEICVWISCWVARLQRLGRLCVISRDYMITGGFAWCAWLQGASCMCCAECDHAGLPWSSL